MLKFMLEDVYRPREIIFCIFVIIRHRTHSFFLILLRKAENHKVEFPKGLIRKAKISKYRRAYKAENSVGRKMGTGGSMRAKVYFLSFLSFSALWFQPL